MAISAQPWRWFARNCCLDFERQPTFSGTIALVRRLLWRGEIYGISDSRSDMVKILRALFDGFSGTCLIGGVDRQSQAK